MRKKSFCHSIVLFGYIGFSFYLQGQPDSLGVSAALFFHLATEEVRQDTIVFKKKAYIENNKLVIREEETTVIKEYIFPFQVFDKPRYFINGREIRISLRQE